MPGSFERPAPLEAQAATNQDALVLLGMVELRLKEGAEDIIRKIGSNVVHPSMSNIDNLWGEISPQELQIAQDFFEQYQPHQANGAEQAYEYVAKLRILDGKPTLKQYQPSAFPPVNNHYPYEEPSVN